MIHYGRATSELDLIQILALQQKNLPAAISFEEKKNEGFVTVSHTLEILSEMNEVCAHIIARSDARVIGYALFMHPEFANKIEVLKPIFNQTDTIHPKIENYIAMGQICVDRFYRGQGIFRQLYRTMCYAVQSEFDYIITEVNAENTRSLNAHYAVGFEDLKTYFSSGQHWKLMVLR